MFETRGRVLVPDVPYVFVMLEMLVSRLLFRLCVEDVPPAATGILLLIVASYKFCIITFLLN